MAYNYVLCSNCSWKFCGESIYPTCHGRSIIRCNTTQFRNQFKLFHNLKQLFTDILSCGCGGKACHILKLFNKVSCNSSDEKDNLSCVSDVSALTKARLKASHDFNFSKKILWYYLKDHLHKTVKCERLVCSAKCIFSKHAYSVNFVKQFSINERLSFFCHAFKKLKNQFCHQF